MRALLPETPVHNGRSRPTASEKTDMYAVVALKGGTIYGPMVRVLCWIDREMHAATHYATIWVDSGKDNCSGFGYAHGYGYNRAPAAIDMAIQSAGIKLDQSDHIGLLDEEDVEAALSAIARAAGYDTTLVIKG